MLKSQANLLNTEQLNLTHLYMVAKLRERYVSSSASFTTWLIGHTNLPPDDAIFLYFCAFSSATSDKNIVQFFSKKKIFFAGFESRTRCQCVNVITLTICISLTICNTAMAGNHHDTSYKLKIYKDPIHKS
jgi:hypothetical protein